jgi:hypothetical protein
MEGNKGSVIIYSAMISDGDQFKTNKRYDDMLRSGSYCDSIKNCKCLYSIVEHVGVGESSDLGEKAINGLYMVFFEKVLKERRFPIKYDELQDTLNGCYNGNLADRELAGHVKEKPSKPEFPIRISSPKKQREKNIPLGYIDVSIGWNLSHQSIAQIGWTWKKWSVFADLSGNWNWKASITHALKESETQQLQDTLIIGLGMGLKWYPLNLKRVDLGLSVSAQTGVVYGEKVISELETIKHFQPYWGITPAASLRWFTSKNHCCRCYFNVGYAFYPSCSINKEIKWRSVVTNFGISIPVCCKNKTK